MRRVFLAATLLTAPAAAAETPTVHLVWSDPERVLTSDFDAMAREVQTVFRPLGIEVGWRRADERSAADDELNVVLLANDPARALHHRETMGRVHRDRSTALWIYAGRVRATLGLASAAGRAATLEERRDYPRAIGRVVAHELVHALVPEQPHAGRGLMQAGLNRAFLASPRASIDERSASALARRFSAGPSEAPILVATDTPDER
jgi:hypothetical protein